MLENQIVLKIRWIVGENFAQKLLQSDGTPPHYGLNVRDCLDTVYHNRWIGRSRSIKEPGRSPDLVLLDFFLCDILKLTLNLEELR